MHNHDPPYYEQTRRDFFTSSASGLGGLALLSVLNDQGLLAAEDKTADSANPLAPKPPHFAPKAKAWEP